jgi:hypothetical protein
VISQGRRNDVARFLNPQRLREDWPQLGQLLSRRTRRACERRLGLPRHQQASSGTDAAPRMPG